jgi:hypothetical protein
MMHVDLSRFCATLGTFLILRGYIRLRYQWMRCEMLTVYILVTVVAALPLLCVAAFYLSRVYNHFRRDKYVPKLSSPYCL